MEQQHPGVESEPVARWSAVVRPAALLGVMLAVLVPFAPLMPEDALDPSWELAMNQTLQQGLVFGRDTVFTFGPYASVYTTRYHPSTDALSLGSTGFLAVCFAAAAWFHFARVRRSLFVLLLVALAALSSRDALLFFYPLLVAAQATWRPEPSGGPRAGAWLIFLLWAPLGLLPLVKGSTIAVCALSAVVSAVVFAQERRWRRALLVLLTPLVALVLFWLAARQPLGALPAYFGSMLQIVKGYSESMGLAGDPKEPVAYGVGALVLVGVLLVGEGRRQRAATALSFAVVLFMAFKAGFIRHDWHARIGGATLLLAALLVFALVRGRRGTVALVTGLALSASVGASHGFVQNPAAPFASAWEGLRRRLAPGDGLAGDYRKALGGIAGAAPLPQLDGTSDVYSFSQTRLVASGNRWSPRPVPQSYSAYTPALAELNARHLAGPGEPDHLFFAAQPIDGRLRLLEDSATWPEVLKRYRPTRLAGDFLVLDRRDEPAAPASRTLATGRHRLGETVPVPTSAHVMLTRWNVRPSAFGRLRTILFKSSDLELTVELVNGTTRKYRFIPGMAEAGVILSPLVEFPRQLGLLFAKEDYLTDRRAMSIRLDAPASARSWASEFGLEFVELTPAAVADVPELLGVGPVREAGPDELRAAEGCEGYVDALNDQPPGAGPVEADRLLTSTGWLVASTRPAAVPDSVFLVLTGADQRRYVAAAGKRSRPDVGAHFGNAALAEAGYDLAADVSGLPAGLYAVQLAYRNGDEPLSLCGGPSRASFRKGEQGRAGPR